MRSSKRLYIFFSLSIATVIFIFANSLQPAAVSRQMSGGILDIVYPFISKLFPFLTENTLSFLIRKAAHMTEFAVLSLFVMLTLLEMKKPSHRAAVYTLFFSLLTACTDEQIQFFTKGRSCEVRDVFVDFAGAVLGVSAVLLIKLLISKRRKSKNKFSAL